MIPPDPPPADAPPTQSPAPPKSLMDLLRAMRPDPGASTITIRTILTRIGTRSFAPAVLIPALILVSPLSAIPGMPTMGALLILTIAVQALMARNHLWLPDFLMRRSLSSKRMLQAIGFLERPAHWVDQHSKRRLRLLTAVPLSAIAWLAVVVLVVPMPFLEILPMATSVGATFVALIAIGLMTRDGFYLVLGYAGLGALVSAAVALWNEIF